MSSVDVVIPVYNEEHSLPACIATLSEFLAERLTNPWRIVIADNGSVDGTLGVGQALSEQYPNVSCVHIEQKGRGRALRRTWLESDADIVSYMDVDLSTGLDAFPELIGSLDEGYGVAIGSRLMRGAKTTRSFKRELTSRGYNFLIKAMFFSSISDAQCGFKAVTRSVAQEIIPLIKDQAWFFDTELLLLALKRGYRIKEVPVEWVEDPDTRVRVLKTAWEDVKGLLRVRFRSP
ncbi:dolichyl-phosphate beta-glucosyltransferase [Chloroflexota bacterium]